jgi:hypothetical protein
MESEPQYVSYDDVQSSYLFAWALSIKRWVQRHEGKPFPQEVYDHFRPGKQAENALLYFDAKCKTVIHQAERHLQATESAFNRFVNNPSERTWQRTLIEAEALQDRIEKVLEAIRRGKVQRPLDDEKLVTAKDVATYLRIERTSLSPKEKEWPEPAVVGKGNRPSQWRRCDLKPVLERQYPRDDWASF